MIPGLNGGGRLLGVPPQAEDITMVNINGQDVPVHLGIMMILNDIQSGMREISKHVAVIEDKLKEQEGEVK
jgi:hypothetical protein